MKIKIIKSEHETWYTHKIGEEFEVDYFDENKNAYLTYKKVQYSQYFVFNGDYEIVKNNNKPSFEELQQAAQPLIDILYKYYNPHTMILVEQDFVEIVCGDMAVPIEIRD